MSAPSYEDAYADYLARLAEANHPPIQPVHNQDWEVDQTAPKLSWWGRFQHWLWRRFG